MSNRAILYLRSSKDRSDVSIDAQRRTLHELAAARNLVIVGEFADVVLSGKDEDRPAFQRMYQELRAARRPWQHVLMLDTARLGRRREISLLFERDCKRRSVKVTYSNVPDCDPITEMLLRTMLQGMDEWHSLTSRQKGLAGMAENVRQGWRAGGRAPRGYKLEYHTTGAIRDGAPVMKSRLVLDDETAPQVQAYLQMRARGISRGTAIGRLQLQWPASSTHSMDWQALTYAGHTAWNVHAEREGGATQDSQKRRPRVEWLINRSTHPALITDDEAEAILVQQERAQLGRRTRSSPLLLSGLLQAPDGTPWHSDGCGFYRLAKGKKIAAARVNSFVLDRVPQQLASDGAVAHFREALQAIVSGPVVDGRTLLGIERRIATLATQIGRTVDLAAELDDPAPVLRRVADLEALRAGLADQLAKARTQREQQHLAAAITDDEVRTLLRRLFSELGRLAPTDDDERAKARQALNDLLEKVELNPETLAVRLHYAVRTGDNLASPRGGNVSPVVRWQDDAGSARHWRRAA